MSVAPVPATRKTLFVALRTDVGEVEGVRVGTVVKGEVVSGDGQIPELLRCFVAMWM